MAKKFRELIEKMPAARRQRIRRKAEDLLAELPLQELRRARELSQEDLAQALGVNQATISKLERRTDMYISTLRRFVEAMGGELEITVRFREGSVRIGQFEDLGSDGGKSAA
jgi:transcriptional regulator with XRE-family HTH domain